MSLAGNIGGEDLGRETSMTKVGVAAFIGALLAWSGSYWPVAVYVMAAGLISFVSVYLATESFREDLTEELARESGTEVGGAGQTTWSWTT